MVQGLKDHEEAACHAAWVMEGKKECRQLVGDVKGGAEVSGVRCLNWRCCLQREGTAGDGRIWMDYRTIDILGTLNSKEKADLFKCDHHLWLFVRKRLIYVLFYVSLCFCDS